MVARKYFGQRGAKRKFAPRVNGLDSALRLIVSGRALVALAMIGLVIGCAARSPVPVVELAQPPTEKINSHWVSEGETIYAIAWRYDLDVNRLAALNKLDSSYTVRVGQTLRLDTENLRSTARGLDKRKVAVSRRAERVAANTKAVAAKHGKDSAALVQWRWPVRGRILKPYSFAANRGHKGLDIVGATGQPVYATQNGTVVYAGDGLPSYGNLLILKHGETYLSAYAHNSRLIVKEGDEVTVGQKVAEVGRSGTTYEHLHFEIRKRGVPINPLLLLPNA